MQKQEKKGRWGVEGRERLRDKPEIIDSSPDGSSISHPRVFTSVNSHGLCPQPYLNQVRFFAEGFFVLGLYILEDGL